MPTYEFICRDCQKTFVLVMLISEYEKNPKPACEHCGSKNVDAMVPRVTVITSKKS